MPASTALEKARDGGPAGGALQLEPSRRSIRLLCFGTSVILVWKWREDGHDVVVRRSRCLRSRLLPYLVFEWMSCIQP